MHFILLHIQEVEVRKLYLKKARSSLYEYLTVDLGYSSASAQRRIEGARLIKEIPMVAEKIKDGSLHLSHIGELVRAVKQKESETGIRIDSAAKLALIEPIECRTISETQRVLSGELNLELRPNEIKTVQKDESVHIQMTLSKEQNERYLACRNRASHKLFSEGGLGFSEVFDHLMKYYLAGDQPPEGKKATSESEVKTNKSITSKTRRKIRARDTHCQYIDAASGAKCGSRFLLEIDHRIPLWAGGTNEESNLTLLCAAHNKAKYRREAGLS